LFDLDTANSVHSIWLHRFELGQAVQQSFAAPIASASVKLRNPRALLNISLQDAMGAKTFHQTSWPLACSAIEPGTMPSARYSQPHMWKRSGGDCPEASGSVFWLGSHIDMVREFRCMGYS